LLEENTGRWVDRQRLTRIHRIGDSETPPISLPSSSRAKLSQREEEGDSGNEKDIENIWEDEDKRQGVDILDDEEMDMEDFIDNNEQDEGMAEEERKERQRERKRIPLTEA
jgi:transcription elongation factor SPT6